MISSSPTKSKSKRQGCLSILTPFLEKLEDYKIIKFLGKGAYSDVYLSENINNSRISAMKTIDKAFLEKEHKQHQVYIERDVLLQLHHHGIIQLISTFQTEEKLYFCLEYAPNGDLADFAKQNGPFNFEQIQFCASEILLALEFIHQNGIVHRDVKTLASVRSQPENLLITQDYHLKLTDFGTAFVYDGSKLPEDRAQRIAAVRHKFGREEREHIDEDNVPVPELCRASSFVGTSEYLCPELIDRNLCGPQVKADLWALGCIVFKLFTGHTPFEDDLEYNVFQKISTVNAQLPPEAPGQAADFIRILLSKDPAQRFGQKIDKSNYSYEALKNHPFFDGVDFTVDLWAQRSPLVEKSKRTTKRSVTMAPMLVGVKVQSQQTESTVSDGPEQLYQTQSTTLKGIVEKESGFLFTSFTPRILTLTIYKNTPSLSYVNPEKNVNERTVIQLAHSSICRLLDKGRFVVEDKHRKKFIFREKQHPAKFWVEEINKALHNL